MKAKLRIDVNFRDLQPSDLEDLGWTGEWPDRERFEASLERTWAGAAEVLVGESSHGMLLAAGEADFSVDPGSGLLRMLAVHPSFRSLGLGTALVAALEKRIVRRGLRESRLHVLHDNHRARALYRRLGYRQLGDVVESWPEEPDTTYVTVSALWAKSL